MVNNRVQGHHSHVQTLKHVATQHIGIDLYDAFGHGLLGGKNFVFGSISQKFKQNGQALIGLQMYHIGNGDLLPVLRFVFGLFLGKMTKSSFYFHSSLEFMINNSLNALSGSMILS